MHETSAVDALKRPEQYRVSRAHLFPSEGSFEWYLRQNRDALTQQRALLRIGGRLFVHESRMDAALVGEAAPV